MPDADVTWIEGLMRENYEAVGFLPTASIRDQYLAHGRVIFQTDERGRRVGYLLHGAPRYGRVLNVAQHCIQDERRRHGYGENALSELIRRADTEHASAIVARVAVDNESLGFWLAQGFRLREVVDGGQRRARQIARLWLPLALPLLEEEEDDAD